MQFHLKHISTLNRSPYINNTEFFRPTTKPRVLPTAYELLVCTLSRRRQHLHHCIHAYRVYSATMYSCSRCKLYTIHLMSWRLQRKELWVPVDPMVVMSSGCGSCITLSSVVHASVISYCHQNEYNGGDRHSTCVSTAVMCLFRLCALSMPKEHH